MKEKERQRKKINNETVIFLADLEEFLWKSLN